jgi:hypothetical protein
MIPIHLKNVLYPHSFKRKTLAVTASLIKIRIRINEFRF